MIRLDSEINDSERARKRRSHEKNEGDSTFFSDKKIKLEMTQKIMTDITSSPDAKKGMDIA